MGLKTKIYPSECKEEKKKLTEHQRKSYEGAIQYNMGWFNPISTTWFQSCKPYQAPHWVSRGYYVAEQLFEKGYFKRRLVGEYPFINFEFKALGGKGYGGDNGMGV